MARTLTLAHITLDTGHRRQSRIGEVSREAFTIAVDIIATALEAGDAGEHPVPGMGPEWSQRLTAEGSSLLVTISRRIEGQPVPVVTFGCAVRSRAGARLWRFLHEGGARRQSGLAYATDAAHEPPEPWIAARMEIGAMLPLRGSQRELLWLGDYERVIGWAWVTRHYSLQ